MNTAKNVSKLYWIVWIVICAISACGYAYPTPAPTVTPTLPCYTVAGPNDYRIEIVDFLTTDLTLVGPNDSESTSIKEGEQIVQVTAGKNINVEFVQLTQVNPIVDITCSTTKSFRVIATKLSKYVVTRKDAADSQVEPTPAPKTPVTILSHNEIHVKDWPDHEKYYACSQAERSEDPWYFTNLSIPLVGDNYATQTQDWMTYRESYGRYHFALRTGRTDLAIAVTVPNYVVEIPEGTSVSRIAFSTKFCDVDWLYIVVPQGVDSESFDFVINTNVVQAPPPASPEFMPGSDPQPNPMEDIYLPTGVSSYWMWHESYGASWTDMLYQVGYNDIEVVCSGNEHYLLMRDDLQKLENHPICDHGAAWLQ